MKRHCLMFGWQVHLIEVCLFRTVRGVRGTERTIFPGVLALACLLVAMPATAQINYAISGNTASVTSSPNASGAIVIASTYNGYPVTSIGDDAFSGCAGLTSVTIPDSVTQIGTTLNGGSPGFVFFDCTSLTNVIIGNNVTNIGYAAFVHCTSLARLTIPASVINIASSAFAFCTSLTNVTFLGNPPRLLFDLEAGGNWFSNVGPGAKVYYHCGTTGWGVTYGGLPTVLLCPQVNYVVSGSTAYVARSPNASGDVVIASTYNGYPVTSIASSAFENCIGLTSVTIPDGVTSIPSYAFSGCRSLASVTIPNSVTSIGSLAFSNCRSLTGVTIPDSVISIGALVFKGCTNLTSLTIPASVTGIGGSTFDACTSLTNLSVDAANPAYSSVDGVLFDKAQTTLLVCPVGRAGSIVIPDSVTRLGTSLYSGPSGGIFSGCARLTNVIIGNNVTNIGFAAFFGCSNLTRLAIPASVVNIGSSAFYNCRSLTNFTILGNRPQLVSDIEAGAAHFVGVGAGAKVYYYCGSTGWGTIYGGLPAVMLCPPQIALGSAGVKPGGFGFTLTSLTNQTIVVEASTDLLNWQPIWTNPPPGTSAEFVDPQWLQHPHRFYRARSE